MQPSYAPIVAYTPITPAMQKGASLGPSNAQFSDARIPVITPLTKPFSIVVCFAHRSIRYE
jgi:hypothetical protein